MEQIHVTNLTKKYGNLTALDNVSLNVKGGVLFGLLGPNGSGKSTMIKCITGQIKPTTGKIDVLGTDVVTEPVKVRESIGIIPEQENPPSFLTAEEYMYFVGKIRNMDKKDIESETRKWFKFLEFDSQKNILCKDLSRGTRQKLMFAQAFLHKPKLAFIDEPLINLDPIIQNSVKDFLLDEVKKGHTIFFSTHILEVAEEICNEVAILHQGKMIYLGKPKKDLSKFFLKEVENLNKKERRANDRKTEGV